MTIIDHVPKSHLSMLVYQAVRCAIVLVSLVMYLCVSRGYQYRVRDWVVNVQWMAEDVFERRIEQEERYLRDWMAENRILLDRSPASFGNDYGSFSQPKNAP